MEIFTVKSQEFEGLRRDFTPFESFTDLLSFFRKIFRADPAFENREYSEKNPNRRQIILYATLATPDGILTYRRQGAEKKLTGKISIGIGGHIEPEDLTKNTFGLKSSLLREMTEELEISDEKTGDKILFYDEKGNIDQKRIREYFKIIPLGVIKDDSNEVGKVHLGISCLLIFKKPAKVRLQEEGTDLKIETIGNLKKSARDPESELEGWAKIVIPHIPSD